MVVADGVPVITPEVAFRDSPAGKAGLTRNVVAPLKFAAVSVTGDIALPVKSFRDRAEGVRVAQAIVLKRVYPVPVKNALPPLVWYALPTS
jgi:hypothetical protein